MKTHMILPPLHPPIWSVTLWVEIHCQPSRASMPMCCSSAPKKVSIAAFTASRTPGSGTLWPLLGSSCCQGCQGGASAGLLQRVLNSINMRFCIYHFSILVVYIFNDSAQNNSLLTQPSQTPSYPVSLPTLLTWAPCPELSACTTPLRTFP